MMRLFELLVLAVWGVVIVIWAAVMLEHIKTWIRRR